ncbi:pyridine nucleotide-disulfide oxidoreductase [Hirsutella rhossiliensis]|uniref:Pyridine nucleotide-disulfide oxidoreductase domain-containing protein n=1 Tax=Hirsutella rhossiliensis TaxID=111463 RepID=A0A9P8N110_9HYPO|nr:pyridine nucleotide-disulfide oxidoreductase domain-containing protein [Hirsutella rhossiliensis]KAH0964937.1 pyridine nucleotide-disulfide oxidoreductase domain-containing protein [Hirsutella rhossiliensis]
MAKTIVILGAGLAAAPLIRQLMRTLVLTRKDLKMVVVAPNSHFYWPIAIPRVMVPGQLADDKVMFPWDSIFGQYPADKFEFVLGKATALDPSAKTVTVALGEAESTRSVSYHTLVIATGASAKDNMPWKLLDTAEKTSERLHSLQSDIKDAKTIVVAGGGATGTETAGELGFEYAKSGDKDVYFVHGDTLPLAPPVLASVRKQARAELDKLKVKVIANTTVTKVSRTGRDTVLELRHADGSTRTLTAQAYIPATGVTPNTSFAPASMLDGRGYIKQTGRLTAEGFDDIFVMGDAGNLEASKAQAAEAQAKHLIKALPVHLDGGKSPGYTAQTKETVAVTLGRSRGAGQMGSLRLFSLLVWYAKGRFLGTNYAPLYAAGKKTMMTTFEK